jgi:hypothetical protein
MAWTNTGFGKLYCRLYQISYIRNHRFKSYENAVRVRRVCCLDDSLLLRNVVAKNIEEFSL